MDVDFKKQSIFQIQAYGWNLSVVRATSNLGSPQVNNETVSGPDDSADARKYLQTNKSASIASGELTVDQSAVQDSAYRRTLALSR